MVWFMSYFAGLMRLRAGGRRSATSTHDSEGSGRGTAESERMAQNGLGKEKEEKRSEWWMRVLYFKLPTCFPEESDFVAETTKRCLSLGNRSYTCAAASNAFLLTHGLAAPTDYDCGF